MALFYPLASLLIPIHRFLIHFISAALPTIVFGLDVYDDVELMGLICLAHIVAHCRASRVWFCPSRLAAFPLDPFKHGSTNLGLLRTSILLMIRSVTLPLHSTISLLISTGFRWNRFSTTSTVFTKSGFPVPVTNYRSDF